MTYIARRLLHGALLVMAVSLLSFAFAKLAPGDYYSEMQSDPRISESTIEGLREQAGLHRSWPAQYAAWAASLLKGDFGYSLAYRGPVAPILWQRIRATLLLTGTATFLAWMLALPLGVWNAVERGTWKDTAARAGLAVLILIPDLLLAILFLLLAVRTGWFPTGGMTSADFGSLSTARRVADIVWHLALPAAVLVLGMLPMLVRHVRSSMAGALESPFGQAARAHGIPLGRRLFRHLLPAALNPLISLAGISLGTLLSASLLVEVVMGWPGLGPLFLDAVMARDVAVVLAVVMLSATLLVLGNLIADLLLYSLDPRIRVK
ncbi:MAG: ABC transporter permease [Bryobacteraceae bacterium]